MNTSMPPTLAEILEIWQQLDPARRANLEQYACQLVAEQRAKA